MKMFAAGGEGTGGESAQRTRRVAVFSLLRSFLAGDAQPPSVPPSCVVARYYRIILGYFTRGASDFVGGRSTNAFTLRRTTIPFLEPFLTNRSYSREDNADVHKRSIQVRGVCVRSSIIEYRAGQIEPTVKDSRAFIRVLATGHRVRDNGGGTARHLGVVNAGHRYGSWKKGENKEREREREKNARYFSRNVHCHDDKSGINRATSRLSININSGSTRAEARIRELDPPLPHVHTDRKMGVDIRSNLLRREQDLRRDRLRTRPLTTSTIFLLAAAARSSFRVVLLPTGPTLRVFPFSSLSLFLSFSKGIPKDSTGSSNQRAFRRNPSFHYILPIREITNLYLNVLLVEARRKERNNSFRLSSTPLLPHQISLLRASTRAEMRKARDPRPTRLVPSLPSSFSSSSLPSLPAVFLLPNPAATSPLSRPLEETVYRPRRGEEITGI